MRKFTLAATVAALAVASTAGASVIENVDLTFQSGASFTGTVTFANDFSYYTAVTGTLSGYTYGFGHTGSGSDAISWSWGNGGTGSGFGNAAFGSGGSNYSTAGAGTYSNWLMDGTSKANYGNYITFGYSYGLSGLTLFGGGAGYGSVNNVNYLDPLVSGSVGVPEPATLALFGLGLAGIGLARRRRSV